MTPRRLHQLEAFRAVMHGGSVTRAAEILSLSQPAVTKLLRALEEETGLSLFDRSRRRLTATHEAHLFEAEVARLFAAAKRVDRLANDMRFAGVGELRVAALPSFGIGFIPALLARFAKTEKGPRVSLTVTSSLEVHDMVQSGQADIGFALPLGAAGALNVAPPFPLPGVLALPPRHRLARKAVVELRDLEREPCVSLGRQYRLRDIVDELFERHGIAPIQVAETQNGAAACEMVAQGLGFTIANPVTAADFGKRLVLRRLRPTVEFPVHVLSPPGRRMSRTATQFLETVQEATAPFLKQWG
ncbi:LysR family transcriptional regulator [Roseomonas nepalensis]|uniref:LysR family transcriptional regulator n=1 Tax=Muricoccus nepalensis TaxID=1854500 RepID=A0A502FWP6_9PROT|nr:LysR family transcriptional regulator [Roseomonas nepalensis]TPG53851.1 LysR family transcriptional regulator [Roseomonas nepalensis]